MRQTFLLSHAPIVRSGVAVLEHEPGVGPDSITRQVYEQLIQSEPFQPFATVKPFGNALEA